VDGAPAAPSGAILTADIGSVHTRVNLFDTVAGQYRLIARAQALTTATPPVGDVGVGLRRALIQLGEFTGRQYVDNGGGLRVGDQIGTAAETFLATASGGQPMRTVLVGLTPEVSIASGVRALQSTYVDLVETISLRDFRTPEQQVNAILRHEPDLIFIVGGIDGGAREPLIEALAVVRLAAVLAPGKKPAVLFAGNDALRPVVYDMLAQEVQLYTTDNVRPDLATARYDAVELELAMIYGDYRARGEGGYGEVQGVSALGLLPTSQSYSTVMRYLGALPGAGAGALYVDVGSAVTTVCAALRGNLHLTIRPDLGLGHSAPDALSVIGPRRVRRWLSFEADDAEITDYALNKMLRPASVPVTANDLEMEYAIARELIREALATSRAGWSNGAEGSLPALRPIIGAGSVLGQPINAGVSALLLLDALQPVGVAELHLDPFGVVAALGVAAFIEPLAAVQVLESGGLLSLATAICPEGRPGSGTAMEATVRLAAGRVVKLTVPAGEVRAVPLPVGQRAQVEVRLGRGLRLNGRARLNLRVEGSAAGLIFDGRGRPFAPPSNLARRAAVLPGWYAAVQGEG
jgi:hypothetical protein